MDVLFQDKACARSGEDLNDLFSRVCDIIKGASRKRIVHIRELNGEAARIYQSSLGESFVMHCNDTGVRLGMLHEKSNHLTWIASNFDGETTAEKPYTDDTVKKCLTTHFKM